MFGNILLFIEVFVFILAILNVVKHIYSFSRILYLKEGKIETSVIDNTLFGLSLSYIITSLIVGF